MVLFKSNSNNDNINTCASQLPKIISNYPHDDDPNVKDESIHVANVIPNNDERKRLVLHYDINETILIGDEAGGDTLEESLNKIIAKIAFVQIPSDFPSDKPTQDIVPTHWWDGTPLSSTASTLDAQEDQEDQLPESSDRQSSDSSSCTGTRTRATTPHIPPLYTGWNWPKGTCPYYRTSYKRKAKIFTEPHGDGTIYRPLYELLKQKISILSSSSSSNSCDITSLFSSHKPHPFFGMVPSFFSTLVKLQEEKREYTLCLRTMGSDLDDIVSALNDFANGKHPLFPNFQEPKLILHKDEIYKGRWRKVNDNCTPTRTPTRTCTSNSINSASSESNIENCDSYESFVFDLFPSKCENPDDDGKLTDPIASGDDAVLNVIETSSVCGIQDDYNHWNNYKYAPWAGKPLWINSLHNNINKQQNRYTYHVFFDDNIHNDENDSIVAVRDFVDGKWVSLSGAQTIQQQGVHLFRVPTVEAILDDNWFHRQISKVEAK